MSDDSRSAPEDHPAIEASPPPVTQEKTKPPPRRRFLIGAGAAALGVAGLGGAAYVRVRYGGLSTAAPGVIPDHRVALPGTTPKMVIARGPSPVTNLAAVLGRIGGMRTLVSRGDVVLIKPNIGWDRTPAQAANTDPELVAALVRACQEAGAKEVIVTDVSCNDAEPSFLHSGIGDAARKAGARVLMPHEVETRAVAIPGKPGVWTMLEPYLRATKVINVPVAKHHAMAKLTAGMKNWFGLVKDDRKVLHAGLSEAIVGLAAIMRPTVTIVDATRVLLRNGPKGGNLADVKRLDSLALSFDPVAVDAWAATELGFDLAGVDHIAYAEKQGLGTANFKSLSPIELRG